MITIKPGWNANDRRGFRPHGRDHECWQWRCRTGGEHLQQDPSPSDLILQADCILPTQWHVAGIPILVWLLGKFIVTLAKEESYYASLTLNDSWQWCLLDWYGINEAVAVSDTHTVQLQIYGVEHIGHAQGKELPQSSNNRYDLPLNKTLHLRSLQCYLWDSRFNIECNMYNIPAHVSGRCSIFATSQDTFAGAVVMLQRMSLAAIIINA
jgi:hypothetical protein